MSGEYIEVSTTVVQHNFSEYIEVSTVVQHHYSEMEEHRRRATAELEYLEMPMQYFDPFDDSRISETIRTNMEENIRRIEARKAIDDKLLELYSNLKKYTNKSENVQNIYTHDQIFVNSYNDENIFETCKAIRAYESKVNEGNPLKAAATTRILCEICQSTHCGETVVYMQCRHKLCTTCMSRLTQCTCPFCRKPFKQVYTLEKDGTDEWKMTTYRLKLNVDERAKQNDNIFIEIFNKNDKSRKRKCNHSKLHYNRRPMTSFDRIKKFLKN